MTRKRISMSCLCHPFSTSATRFVDSHLTSAALSLFFSLFQFYRSRNKRISDDRVCFTLWMLPVGRNWNVLLLWNNHQLTWSSTASRAIFIETDKRQIYDCLLFLLTPCSHTHRTPEQPIGFRPHRNGFFSSSLDAGAILLHCFLVKPTKETRIRCLNCPSPNKSHATKSRFFHFSLVVFNLLLTAERRKTGGPSIGCAYGFRVAAALVHMYTRKMNKCRNV